MNVNTVDTYLVAAEVDVIDRLDTLYRISDLRVTCYVKRGVRYFVFWGPDDRTVKSVCTYRKAKTFAEGVALGRILEKGI